MPSIDPSSLIFSSASNSASLSRTLNSLKQRTLSIPNRLNSILSDAEFVRKVSSAYNLPLIANERCGSWYIPSEEKAASAYFKSTDGHTGEWSFSLRRLNVQVFDVIGKYGGTIIVDSTRRGKAMPDALMKTVPIWCTVFNRVLFPESKEEGLLYTPPNCVSASEHAQIEQRLPGFIQDLLNLKLDLDDLRSKVKKPLRPIWVTRDSELPQEPPVFEQFHPVVLCTASRRVHGGEISEGGYIQGAGDDAESWAKGLTPAIFWKHKDLLMSASEDELPEAIEDLLSEETTKAGTEAIFMIKNAPWLSIGSFGTLTPTAAYNADAIITVGNRNALPKLPIPKNKHLHLECRDRKLGSRDLRTQLPQLRSYIEGLASTKRILVCDASGKDLAPGVALAILCLYADDSGRFHKEGAGVGIDKVVIKQRLSWIMTSDPGASPSRTTLQSINDFLLTEYTKNLPMRTPQNQYDGTHAIAETIFHALSGVWTLNRDIVNHRSDGLAGTVTGTAVFASRTPTVDTAEAEYLYREEGTFNAGPGMQMTVNRRWVWRLESHPGEEKSISIHFVKADGETVDYLYNRLPVPSTAQTVAGMDSAGQVEKKPLIVEAEHPCGKDFYISKYTFHLGASRLEEWSVRHEVKGPSKDYVSTTMHTRA